MTSVFVNPDDWLTLTFRMTLALLAGGAVGWNRQIHAKPGGLRTHMLVSLGAALFVIIPLQASVSQSADALSRVIQGVATGIGFVGAGEILHQSREDHRKPQVKGLTSAAAIWVTAALGMEAGCGYWQVCLIGTLMVLGVLSGAKRLEKLLLVQRDEEN